MPPTSSSSRASAALHLPTLLLLLPLLAGCEDLVYFPAPLAPEQARAVSQRHATHAEELRIAAAEGVVLHGWLARGTGNAPRPLVIYSGGNAEEVSWMLDRRDAFAGWSVALVNYRGYGRSEGRPSQQARLDLPLQMIVAERDDVIPLERSLALYEVWAGPKRRVTVPGAGHNDLELHPDYWRAIRAFLASLGPGGMPQRPSPRRFGGQRSDASTARGTQRSSSSS